LTPQKIPFWWLVLAAMTINILAQAIHEGGQQSFTWRLPG
jgi:hypothetical protein